jgi:hypothetical protein
MKELDRSLASLERVFAAVRDLHARAPQLRFGQMLVVVLSAEKGGADLDGHLFNKENNDLEAAVRKFTEGLDRKS